MEQKGGGEKGIEQSTTAKMEGKSLPKKGSGVVSATTKEKTTSSKGKEKRGKKRSAAGVRVEIGASGGQLPVSGNPRVRVTYAASNPRVYIKSGEQEQKMIRR